jgi:N-acetyl-alpha-D-muramate 1-phosphate uridylyltransferase
MSQIDARRPVVILAGGLGTRLGALTTARPKCLVEIHGEPFARHQLRLLRDQGVRRVLFCVGHLGEQVRAAVGNGSDLGIQVDYAFDGPRLRGTAGAIKRCLDRLPESFFVMYGDSYLPCAFEEVEETFSREGRAGLMTVHANKGRWDASNVEFRDGRIAAYSKTERTERMRHIDYGLGMFHRRAFARVPEDRAFDLATLYQDLLKRGELSAHEVAERFYEIGSPSGLEETRNYIVAHT